MRAERLFDERVHSLSAHCPLFRREGRRLQLYPVAGDVSGAFGVRVNAIAPGFFMTEQNHALQFNPDGTPTPRCAHIVNGTPMRRYGELKELIGAMLFLVDERAASFVTGVVLPVDGGYSAFSGV